MSTARESSRCVVPRAQRRGSRIAGYAKNRQRVESACSVKARRSTPGCASMQPNCCERQSGSASRWSNFAWRATALLILWRSTAGSGVRCNSPSIRVSISPGCCTSWRAARSQTTLPDMSTGRRLRWLLGDLDNLLLQIRDSRKRAGAKLHALLQFIGSCFDFSGRQEVLRWSDPRPGLLEFRQWLAALRK